MAGSHAADGAFLALARDSMKETWRDEMRYTANIMFEKDNNYTLFRTQDWKAWVTFTTVFIILIVLDNVVMARNPHVLTIGLALVYTLFWVLCACSFCGWVYWYYDEAHAFMWMSGYLLEWMLSFDNLFVFHLIFKIYHCPDEQKHKALFLGIIGAVVFRVIFIFIGEYLMHTMFFMHLVFGAFLIYTGVKTMLVDEEDEDPTQQPLVLWLQKNMSFVSVYDKNQAFFVKLPTDDRGTPLLPELINAHRDGTARDGGEAARLISGIDKKKRKGYGTVDFEQMNAKLSWSVPRTDVKVKSFATMLFLVVCCLEISDVMFAVDSVSAIVAQVPDLFLAYTSCVFAMLGLRAMFFIIDVLVKLFTLLKYGVGIVLVFIGIKLCLNRWWHVPPGIVCAVLFCSIAGSMLASWIKDKYCPDPESEGDDDADSTNGTRAPSYLASSQATPAGSRLATPASSVPGSHNSSRNTSPAIPQKNLGTPARA